jgi:A/G-specific adenine glycosylase
VAGGGDLLDWWEGRGRDLPWRRTRDPWAILVSEVMLQQTQVERVVPRWSAFLERFPSAPACAARPAGEVLGEWAGLGYNRRAVDLWRAAVAVVDHHGGRFPTTLDGLLALPGVGPYTARAVLAIAFGRPVAALDTNIRRVLDRALGPLPLGARELQAAADGFVPDGQAAPWTHALMDIGATICRKRDPICATCPILAMCRSAGTVVTPARAAPRRHAEAPARFESTSRWLRGRILDRLRDAQGHAWIELDGPIGEHASEAVQAALTALGSEGLIEVDPVVSTRARLAE